MKLYRNDIRLDFTLIVREKRLVKRTSPSWFGMDRALACMFFLVRWLLSSRRRCDRAAPSRSKLPRIHLSPAHPIIHIVKPGSVAADPV